MLLPQTKEREYRFKLALRMGLPIFALILAFISHTLITNYQNLQTSFFIEAALIVLVGIYFLFYLIYSGFKVKITDEITETFSREYLYDYLKKEIQEKTDYTLVLISISNLSDINTLYGLKNGDKVLKKTVHLLADFFSQEGKENFPIGHVKGGDFILGFEGKQEYYKTLIDMLALKLENFTIDAIEVKFSLALTDTSYSKDLDYLVEHLFDLQEKGLVEDEQMNPNELESAVILAIKDKNIHTMRQAIFHDEEAAFYECFVKIKGANDKLLYPKKYMKVINKFGLGLDFNSMVLEYIAQTCHNRGEICAVNILPSSLRNEKFLLQVNDILTSRTIRLMFIISEAEYYTPLKKYKGILDTLRQKGVLITIDKVGSLHTSFLYLRDLDIDCIRFDTYYSKKEKLQENRNILEGFCIMAREKGIKTWIKNIEDEASYQLASSLQIDYIQGKYLSKLEKNRNVE